MNINNYPIAMEYSSEASKDAQSLQTLASGPFSSSLSSLSCSSRTLPSDQDFHFFKNFDGFKLPIDQIAKISDSLLESIGSSAKTWCVNKAIKFPDRIGSIADDEAYDWLVDINDEILERFDVSVDEFQNIRKKEEETGRFIGSDPEINGFQLVYEKKKKKGKMASLEVEEKPSEVKQNAIWGESKKMWAIAGPAILVSVSQFSIGFVTVAFAGHLGELELAAVTITTNVIEGFVFGIMLGMGSALETLCGQAVGAGQHNMLGIYLQRSWIITGITALCLTPCYLLATPILNLLRQDKAISELAGKYCKMVIPQFFAYAMNFPIQKFLQSQTKVWVMTIISIIGLGCHVLLNWALVTKLEFGLLGAAMAGNISWWLQVIAMVIYVVAGFFPDSWTGLSLLAFKSLWGFVKLSLASAVMLCLELWYFTAIILMVGYLKGPTLAVDSISICLNLQLWTSMVTLGFNIAASVRVSNELGAGRPKAAKFSIVVVVLTSLAVGVIFMAIILATKHDFPKLFTDKQLVIKAASKLGYFLAATIFLNSILPVLHGVAVGAGWQAYVGLINITCYYLLGIPGGALLGFKFKLRVQGIWFGMLIGTVLQTTILLFVMLRATWRKEAVQAEERLRTWGGPTETPNISLESNSAG